MRIVQLLNGKNLHASNAAGSLGNKAQPPNSRSKKITLKYLKTGGLFVGQDA
jgi:hypothetical protein